MSISPEPESGGTRQEIQEVLPAYPHGPTLAWWGTVMGVISYGMVLVTVLFAYAFLAALAGGWPPAGVERPDLLVPSLATVVLVLSILPAVALQRAAKTERPGFLQSAGTALAAFGAVHLLLQASTYTDLPMAPTEGAYGSVFLVTLVLHHLGLAAGMVAGLMLAVQVWDRPGERIRGGAISLALWWYGMVGFWLLVYGTLYVSPLVLVGGAA
jgi:heme/copper-type cytochrome/quinol oxidase subunit 3